MSPTFAYHVCVLLELNVVVPVSIGISLSILICADVCIVSVLLNLSIE